MTPAESTIHRELTIEVVHRNDALHVEIVGELDMATAPLLDEELRRVEASRVGRVVVDLSDVSFLDSTGLRALIAAHRRSLEDGDWLRIAGAQRQARQLFELAGVLGQLPLAAASGPAGTDARVHGPA